MQFAISRIYEAEEDVWKCNILKGWVLNIDPKKQTIDPLMYWMPETLDHDPMPEWTITVDSRIYIKVETTSKDIITRTTVSVLESDPTNFQHAEPPPTEAGNTAPPPLSGCYFYKLADFEDDGGGGLKVKNQYHQGGPIIHRPVLPEFHNMPAGSGDVGSLFEIMKDWDSSEARYDVRSILQIYDESSGQNVIKEHLSGEPPYDLIRVKQVRDRIDSDTPTGPPIPKQINVVTSSNRNSIVVKGNSFVGESDFTFGNNSPAAIMAAIDGLVVETGNFSVPNYVPGEGIAFTQAGNEYTISTTGLSGFEELNLWVCIEGTPTEYTFLVKPA